MPIVPRAVVDHLPAFHVPHADQVIIAARHEETLIGADGE